ncbi:ABC transporter permease [Micromonospora sp. R77]|uniref:FtsX-like permease family protein n=1 Tax=Micromonospora sp. R77 TaxID=2925836 RepID=UPI001F60C411|nr:ABC transporter permease [Micromonospora sp. R77]MCI4064814.1 ABC transporter permease [Micromonospora sp. R77]
MLPPDRVCPYETTEFRSVETRRQALADPRCSWPSRGPDGLGVPTVVDGDGATLPALTGAPASEVAAASAVLRAGGVVVTDPRYLVAGRVTVTATGPATRPTGLRPAEGPEAQWTLTATLPGHVLRGGVPVDRLLLSPAAAARVGLVGQPFGFAVDTTTAPTGAQRERLAADLRPLAALSVQVEQAAPRPDRRPLLLLLAVGAGVITLGAAGVATGLAAAEGRRDLSTLAAVGASPRVRRVLSLCQAGVIAVLGSVLGIVAGVGSAVIILASVNRSYAESWPVQSPYPVVVPWSTLGVLVVVPLLAMLGAALFTRSRLPVERRLD